jgi:hypothetical protein
MGPLGLEQVNQKTIRGMPLRDVKFTHSDED